MYAGGPMGAHHPADAWRFWGHKDDDDDGPPKKKPKVKVKKESQ